MTDQTGVDWPTCGENGCIGVQLAQGGKCLVHATTRRRKAAFKEFTETAEFDARGVLITDALLEQILAAAPRDTEDHPKFAAARFARATFQGDARFDGVTFEAYTGFGGVTFQGIAAFERAAFQGDAAFYGATFQGAARFEGATFQGIAAFYGATFQDIAAFSLATFQTHAWFEGATFQTYAWFNGVTFQGDAEFGGATFQGAAGFEGATFQSNTAFDGATFRRDAKFVEVRFEQARQLGPLLVYGVLRPDAAHFAQPIQIEVSTRGLSCQRTRFPAGVQFRLRGAQIVLDDADLSSPSILAGVDGLSDARLVRREQQLVQALRRLAPQAAAELSARPRLLSVQGANVAGLGLANVDLADCRFAGAHNLDRLRLESEVAFPKAHVRLPWDWRRMIAEERAWRAARSERWATPQWWPAWLHEPFGKEWPGVLSAGQIAGLYRALRKGREDAKDEPGAADFYYGEMEMRRHDLLITGVSRGWFRAWSLGVC